MPRKRITEYKAKEIVFGGLSLPFNSIGLTSESVSGAQNLEKSKKYVVKVDQGVKKRFKRGLIGINVVPAEVQKYLKKFIKEGFSNFLVEEFVPHDETQEQYIAFEQVREGIKVIYSPKGGVEIESNSSNITNFIVPTGSDKLPKVFSEIGIEDFVRKIIEIMEKEFISFLEINPLLIIDGKPVLLDLAVEVDSTGEYFVDSWKGTDLITRNVNEFKTKEEEEVEKLASKSTASFRLNILNPNGSIFMLLSGGGASIVAADEAYQLGYSKEIANYGEYSGNPNTEETYIYTKNVLNLVLKSKAKKKVIVIAGGVANFTDVYKTFSGVIQALNEKKSELKTQKIKVFVRRGGPNEKKGLSAMKTFLEKESLLGRVEGSDYIMTDIISDAINYLK